MAFEALLQSVQKYKSAEYQCIICQHHMTADLPTGSVRADYLNSQENIQHFSCEITFTKKCPAVWNGGVWLLKTGSFHYQVQPCTHSTVGRSAVMWCTHSTCIFTALACSTTAHTALACSTIEPSTGLTHIHSFHISNRRKGIFPNQPEDGAEVGSLQGNSTVSAVTNSDQTGV